MRMEEDEFDFLRQIAGVSKFKKNDLFISEIVLNSFCFWGDYGLAQGQMLENASWHIYLVEDVAVIRNDAEVASLNRLDNLSGFLAPTY